MSVNKFVVMRLLAKVKVARQSMLEEVHDQVTCQNVNRPALRVELQTLRHNLFQYCGQHESRAERHKIAQVAPLPVLVNNNRPAKGVGQSRGEAENDADR